MVNKLVQVCVTHRQGWRLARPRGRAWCVPMAVHDVSSWPCTMCPHGHAWCHWAWSRRSHQAQLRPASPRASCWPSAATGPAPGVAALGAARDRDSLGQGWPTTGTARHRDSPGQGQSRSGLWREQPESVPACGLQPLPGAAAPWLAHARSSRCREQWVPGAAWARSGTAGRPHTRSCPGPRPERHKRSPMAGASPPPHPARGWNQPHTFG